MDLKALIAKMDQIDSNTVLNEGFPTVADAKARAEKEKTTGKFDKKETSTGTQYTRKSSTFTDGGDDSDTKKAKKKAKNEDIEFNSSIAQSLVEEFGYEVEEDAVDERITINPDGTTSGGIAPAPAAAPAAAASPWANDPAKDAAWKALSPEDQKWLGGADPTDPFILARAPNKGKPAATGGTGAGTKPAAATPAAAAATPSGGVDDEGNIMPGFTTDENGNVVKADDSNFVEPATQALAQQGRADAGAATKPADAPAQGGINPTVLNRYKELLDKLEGAGKKPAAAPAKPAAKPATGAGTKPAETPAAGKIPGVGTMGVNDPTTGMPSTPMAETVNYQDDQTLLAIKNIRF